MTLKSSHDGIFGRRLNGFKFTTVFCHRMTPGDSCLRYQIRLDVSEQYQGGVRLVPYSPFFCFLFVFFFGGWRPKKDISLSQLHTKVVPLKNPLMGSQIKNRVDRTQRLFWTVYDLRTLDDSCFSTDRTLSKSLRRHDVCLESPSFTHTQGLFSLAV